MPEPKSPDGYKLGIVNPMTLVGTEVKAILRERSFPFAKVSLMDTSGEGAGALTEMDEEPMLVAAASQAELEDCDLVFFCGPAENNRPWLERAEDGRFIAIDLSQPSTVEQGRLAVAGLNLDEVLASDIIVSPHPVTIPIALVLHQIRQLTAVDLCAVTVIQPASEFEQAGVEELAQQTISVLNVQSVPKAIFDRQLAFNLYPALEHREQFIVSQIRSLVDPRMELALFITQGTIFHGHTFSIFVKLKEDLRQQEIIDALRRTRAIAFPEGDQSFGTIDAAGRDEVLIAEVRSDPTIRGGCWVWAVCDNLRRASALNAVLIAEKVLFEAGVN